ncbi:MAG: hypothetical protein R3B99_15565 [Polyangiales bacterium]
MEPDLGSEHAFGPDGGRPVSTEKPDQALAFIEQANLEALFYLPGFPAFERGANRSHQGSHRRFFRHRGQVVFASPAFELRSSSSPSSPSRARPRRQVYHRFVSSILKRSANNSRFASTLQQ